ncbi:MAG TPA: hypothetical protein VFP21_09265 [Solirubrobacterales bacterium]|nr:hypothetical protein [Solirubrobacterales bacterium]
MNQSLARPRTGNRVNKELIGLIRRPPDARADTQALRCLADADDPAGRRLYATIRIDEPWREQPLRELFHGLELVEPTGLWDRFSVRAVNILQRAGFASWSDLCRTSAAEIEQLQGAGHGVIEETVGTVAREWARAHLRRWESHDTHGIDNGTGSSDSAAAVPDELTTLPTAFDELEETPGFDAFERSRLQLGPPLNFRSVARATGRSPQAISAKPRRIDKVIHRRLRDETWPVGIAVSHLKKRLGLLAHPSELKEELASIHRETEALPKEAPQRRALLLYVAEYRETEEWVLGPDVETVTVGLINAFAGKDAAEVERISTHLTSFGIREHLQLPWLANQYGYRIIDGTLVPES